MYEVLAGGCHAKVLLMLLSVELCHCRKWWAVLFSKKLLCIHTLFTDIIEKNLHLEQTRMRNVPSLPAGIHEAHVLLVLLTKTLRSDNWLWAN